MVFITFVKDIEKAVYKMLIEELFADYFGDLINLLLAYLREIFKKHCLIVY